MLTLGVEEEFLLVDEAGRLAQQGPQTLAQTDERGVDLTPELLQCQVETATGICSTHTEVCTELGDMRGRLSRTATERGLRLIASGTVVHEQDSRSRVVAEHRYRRMARYFGTLVSDAVTCGCHVHVAIDDLDTAVRVSNHLRPWLPALLAQSANSPFHDGRRTGYASSRYMVWSRWPTAGPPPYLESAEQYETMVRGMLASAAAMDRKMIYWDVRPSEVHDTIELRVHDVQTTPAEAALLAILVRQLVAESVEQVTLGERADPIPDAVLRGHLWRAARDGLEGRCLDPSTGDLRPTLDIIGDLVRRLPEADEAEFARETFAWLESDGGGAHRQEAAFARQNRLDDVVTMLADQTA